MRKNIVYINYLKALSVLYIVAYWHLFNYTSHFPSYKNIATSLLTNTVLGVFTIVSGYLVAISLQNNNSTSLFYSKKFMRIYPLYLLALVLFYFFDLNSFIVSLKSIFLITMLDGPAPRTLWYITMLAIFYLVSPLLYKVIASTRRAVLQIILLTFLIVVFIFYTKKVGLHITVDPRLALYFPCFCLGILVARYDGEKLNITKLSGLLILLLISILITITTFDLWLLDAAIPYIKRIPFTVISSYFVFYAFQMSTSLPNSKVINLLSYSSFSMYLFHRPIFEMLRFLYFPEEAIFQVIYLMLFCVSVIFLLSYVIQKTIDFIFNSTFVRSSA